MLRVFPSIANEEQLLDDVDRQPVNQEGSVMNIVNNAEEWVLEAVVKDVCNDDNIDDIELVA
jgi:hypothetical protein